MVLVDSSVWIEAARREGRLDVKVGLEGLLEEFEAAWCGPVKLEVLGGARKSERQLLTRCFECIPYVSTPDNLWESAKTNSWRLRDQGHSLPWNDILIASLAIAIDCRVYAVDKHFEVMEQVLHVRLYHPDYGGKFQP